MSKTTLVLVALCFVAGVAITLFTPFNPLTFITNFATTPIDTVNSLTETLTQHWQLLTSGLAGFAGAFTLFSKVYGNMKAKAKEAQTITQGKLLAATEAKSNVEATLKASTDTVAEQTGIITETQAELTKTQQALTAKQKEIDRLIIEKNEAQRLFGDQYVERVEKAIEKSKRVP